MVSRTTIAAMLAMALWVIPQTGLAGGLIRGLVCDNGVRIQERPSGGDEAFAADPARNTIFANPWVLSGLSQPVVNYEFSVSCLRLSGGPDDMCAVVDFMRERNLLYSNDLEVLQSYFVSRARTVRNASEKDFYYRRIKDLYSCY